MDPRTFLLMNRGSGSSGGGGGGGGVTRTGIPRQDGRAVRDDVGEFYPLGLTFMWSLQGSRNEPDRYRQNLAWAAAKGFDFKRPLCEVGWADPLRIDPTRPEWSDWRDVIARDLDVSYDEYGLRNGVTLSGKGTDTDLVWLAEQVGAVIAAGREHKVLACEAQNEYSNGGSPLATLEAMIGALQQRVRNILGLSCPGSEQEIVELKAAAQRLRIPLYIRHYDRTKGSYGWRLVRQAYDCKDDRPLVSACWEPAGPGSSVNTLDSPLQLAMMRAVTIMCGGPIFILHTGTGVYGNGKPGSGGELRPPNFWEIPNIDAIVDAVRGIDVLLPAGLPNWQVANTGWVPPNPVAPFQPHAFWEGETGEGVNKAYSALAPDGRVIQMPCGVRTRTILTASYPLREVTVYDPLTRQALAGFENLTVPQGSSIELPGGGQDAMVAYIIRGRR